MDRTSSSTRLELVLNLLVVPVYTTTIDSSTSTDAIVVLVYSIVARPARI